MLRRNFIKYSLTGIFGLIALPFTRTKNVFDGHIQKITPPKSLARNQIHEMGKTPCNTATFTCYDGQNNLVWEHFMVWDIKQNKFVKFGDSYPASYWRTTV